MAKVIDGTSIAKSIRAELAAEVAALAGKADAPPGLAVIIVGTRKDSETYVANKEKAAREIGINSVKVALPEDVTQEVLEAKIQELNEDPAIHGFILQLPLPKHIDEARALERIAPTKDVDGLHAVNVGMLHSRGKQPYFLPCTPLGCMELLRRSDIAIEGKRAVVVGRSNIVGQPVAQLLLQANATVTICHSKTVNMEAVVREADIVVAACGQTEFIRGAWIKPGAAIIDVGINAVPDATKKAGHRLVGDVNYAECAAVAGAITPVPGGVGPMTIAMLLNNTVRGYKRSLGLL